MTTSDQKDSDQDEQKEEQAASPPARRKPSDDVVPHAPGGPGWISEHSMWFWIAGFVIAVSALVIYMIIDNQ